MIKIIIKTEKLSVNDDSELFHNGFRRSPDTNLFCQEFSEVCKVREAIFWLMFSLTTFHFEVIKEVV